MEVANRTIQLFFVKMGRQVAAHLVLVLAKGVNGLCPNGKKQRQTKRRNDKKLGYMKVLIPHFPNINPRPMDRSILFSNFQKNLNSPNTQPKKTKST